MKKIITPILIIALLAIQILPALAATSASGAAQEYLVAIQRRVSANQQYNQDLAVYNSSKTPANEQKAVVSGKAMLNAWLDEAQAWLTWKNLQAKENPNVPQSIKDEIQRDVNTNLAKIANLRTQVAGINNLVEGIVVFLGILQKYGELLVDVARNAGAVWVVTGNKILDTADKYESQLRSAAQTKGSSAAIALLDSAKSNLQFARSKVQSAGNSYKLVVLTSTPFVNFSQGNVYLNQAKIDLMTAQNQMVQAFNLIVSIK